MNMKLITVIGARPQFIKAAVVSRILQQKQNIQEIIVHTGQHYDENMSDIFFEEMQIPKPQYQLETKETFHGAMTGKMMQGIEEILLKEKPVAVLVYGDTNTTLAATLAAAKLHIHVVHIEAGLRSFDMQMPEEVNRIVTDRLSRLLCCPTLKAIENLNKEGFENFDCLISLTGDVMLDAAMYYQKLSKSIIFEKLSLQKDNYFLCTVHRAENTNNPEKLKNIFTVLDALHKIMKVVVPLHPRTLKCMQEYGIATNVTIIDPLGYFDMLQLTSNCKLVLTDSGGLQKEAFFFNKFCVTLREQTEWVELVEHNCNIIAGTDVTSIINAVDTFSSKKFQHNLSLYGDGNAGEKIAGLLETSIFAPA